MPAIPIARNRIAAPRSCGLFTRIIRAPAASSGAVIASAIQRTNVSLPEMVRNRTANTDSISIGLPMWAAVTWARWLAEGSGFLLADAWPTVIVTAAPLAAAGHSGQARRFWPVRVHVRLPLPAQLVDATAVLRPGQKIPSQ